MKSRLLPSPWLSAALLLLWMLLADAPGLGSLLLGIVCAVGAPLLVDGLRPGRAHLKRPGVVLRLVGRIAVDMLRSNLDVLLATLRPGRLPHSAFVRMPLHLRDPHGLAALAMILAAIPGTVWCELSPDGRELLVHVFDLQDEQTLLAQIHERYERPLMEIFE